MYTLRIVEKSRENETQSFDEVVQNCELGNSYSLIRNNTREFNKFFEQQLPGGANAEMVEKLLFSELGTTWFIEYDTEDTKFEYYIMTDSGKTFERL